MDQASWYERTLIFSRPACKPAQNMSPKNILHQLSSQDEATAEGHAADARVRVFPNFTVGEIKAFWTFASGQGRRQKRDELRDRDGKIGRWLCTDSTARSPFLAFTLRDIAQAQSGVFSWSMTSPAAMQQFVGNWGIADTAFYWPATFQGGRDGAHLITFHGGRSGLTRKSPKDDESRSKNGAELPTSLHARPDR